MVRASEKSCGQALVHGRVYQLGHRSLPMPVDGAGQPYRLNSDESWPIEMLQGVITLAIFVPFVVLYMDETLRWNY